MYTYRAIHVQQHIHIEQYIQVLFSIAHVISKYGKVRCSYHFINNTLQVGKSNCVGNTYTYAYFYVCVHVNRCIPRGDVAILMPLFLDVIYIYIYIYTDIGMLLYNSFATYVFAHVTYQYACINKHTSSDMYRKLHVSS